MKDDKLVDCAFNYCSIFIYITVIWLIFFIFIIGLCKLIVYTWYQCIYKKGNTYKNESVPPRLKVFVLEAFSATYKVHHNDRYN